MVAIDKHIEFYQLQIQEVESEWAKYLNTKVLDLQKNSRLLIGKIWGYDNSRGSLILRFRKGNGLRLKIPQTLCYVNESAGNPTIWEFDYKTFRQKHTEGYTSSLPVFFLKSDNPDFFYVGVQGVDAAFISFINNDLENKSNPLIVLAEQDPPIQYLINLKQFLEKNPNSRYLDLPNVKDDVNWSPTNLGNNSVAIEEVLDILSKNSTTIIQGPQGTGKTHLIASICSTYIAANKKVCVTALTNKALMEVAEKESLSKYIRSGKVLKTNLSADEEKNIPNLKYCSNPSEVTEGQLILSTYYKLSFLLNELDRLSKIYDLIIIEEASQAFLATLAAFTNLGSKVLVVGDPMQLSPIVLNESKTVKIHPEIKTVIDGLKTFSYNQEDISFRMRHTYRLTNQAAFQTGIFYNNSLVSVSPLNTNPTFLSEYSHLFCPSGGSSLLLMDIAQDGKKPKVTIDLIIAIVQNLLSHNQKFKVSILTPFKATNFALYDAFASSKIDMGSLEIETIDRIQGLTCDVSIILLPFEGIVFGFQENRFNVATSRAKRGTLIISDTHIDLLQSSTKRVKEFLSKIKKVTI